MAYSEDVNINLNVLAGAMGGITAIMGGMSALTSTFGQFGTEAVDNFGAIDGLLVTTTALVASFGVQAAEAFGEFEQGMKIVQVVSGQSAASVAQLGDAASQLSVHYRTAIGDITEGLQTLGRAGLNSATTQMEVLESGLQTAKLEGRNLNGVLEEIIQNTAMLGGDLKSIDFGEQSSYLNSLMVGTSMTAPIDSHDISQTMQYAGGTAAAAGANLENKDKLEDLMGTVAAFAQKGVKGSMAGTALRAFFTKPASQDESVTDALGRIGLSPGDLWEDGGNSMRKVSDQIGIIQRRMDALHLSTMDQVELWGKIVGPKMGQQMMKLDASSIRELTTDIQGAESAQSLANRTLDTYNQKLSSLSQQGQVAFRGLGEKAVMFLNPVVDILNIIMQIASNPIGNMAVWIGGFALLGHGIRAAWGMIQALYTEIKGLIMSVVDGVETIAASTTGVSRGLGQNASQTELWNAKLKETNATMQAIQANAMGINGMNWTANGGAIGDKIDKGVISSMERNMIMGGTSQNGLNFGVPGQYYRLSDKAGLEQEMRDQSAANKASVERINKSSEALSAEIRRVEGRLGRINETIATYRGYQQSGGTNPALLAQAKKELGLSDDEHLPAYRAPLLLSQHRAELESQLSTMPKDNVRAKMMEEAGVTEQDIIASRKLIEAKKEAELAYKKAKAEYDANQIKYAENTPVDSKGQPIKNRDAYVNETRAKLDAGQFDDTKTGKRLLKDLEVAEEAAAASKGYGFVDMQSSQYEATVAQIEKIKQLEAEIKQTSGANLYKLIQQAETERQSVLVKLRQLYAAQGALPSTEQLNSMFPQMSDKEIKAMTKELTTKLQTQIQIVEEEVYKAEMARLEKLAATSPIAAQTLADNRELEKAGQSRVAGTLGYRQMVTNSPVKEPPSEVVGMAMANQANQNALKMANAMEQASVQAAKQVQGVGTRIRQKLQSTGQSYINSWSNLFTGGGAKINSAINGITLSLNGLQSLIPQMHMSVEAASNDFLYAGMTFEQAMTELSTATGLTTEQIALLTLSEAEGTEHWLMSIASMCATNDEELVAIQQVIRAKLAEAGASGATNVGKFRGALQSVTGFMGGPMMAAMMAFTVASSLYQQSVSNWQKEMSDASNKLSEAKDKMTSAEDTIRELYSSENNTISEADLDKIVDYQYGAIQKSYNADLDKHGAKKDPKFGDMYDNEVIKVQNLTWTDEEKENYTLKTAEDLAKLNESTETLSLTEEEHIKKLEDNTAALNQASYAFSQALSKKAQSFNDPMHGYEGLVTALEDDTGLDGLMALLSAGGGQMFSHVFKDDIWDMFNLRDSYFKNNSPVLTKYQSSENYEGSTETSPIMSMDIYQLGVEGGLRQFFGSDYKSLVDSVDHINRQQGSMVQYFSTLTNNGFQGMDATDFATAQMLWKEDPQTIQKLGKQMYWSETEHHDSAMNNWHKGKLQQRNSKENHKNSRDAYKDVEKKKYTVNDKNLQNTMDKIYRMTDGKLSYANILAMGQMQQFGDMLNVANEQIYPMLSQQLIAANQNVLATGTAGSNAGQAASGAGAAANNAAVIAGMLGEKLKAEATGLEYENDYLNDPNAPKSWWGLGPAYSKEEFTQKMSDLSDHDFDKYRENRWRSLAEVTARTQHPEWTQDEINSYADRSMSKILNSDGTLKDGVYRKQGTIDDTILSPALKTLEPQIRSMYEQSNVGEYGGNSGSGGSGSGGGSGDGSDKSNSGSTRSRVDLVLCSKKTIPKLNVNLFKKAPNFTILNKNFKLRDIKINSQDKPDAITDAIKNGIIETQKRMDPKIIQSEESVYDPVTSTDGTSIPSGNTPVSSDR